MPLKENAAKSILREAFFCVFVGEKIDPLVFQIADFLIAPMLSPGLTHCQIRGGERPLSTFCT